MLKFVNTSHKIMTILLVCWKVLLFNLFSNLIVKLHIDIIFFPCSRYQGDKNMPKQVD